MKNKETKNKKDSVKTTSNCPDTHKNNAIDKEYYYYQVIIPYFFDLQVCYSPPFPQIKKNEPFTFDCGVKREYEIYQRRCLGLGEERINKYVNK